MFEVVFIRISIRSVRDCVRMPSKLTIRPLSMLLYPCAAGVIYTLLKPVLVVLYDAQAGPSSVFLLA